MIGPRGSIAVRRPAGIGALRLLSFRAVNGSSCPKLPLPHDTWALNLHRICARASLRTCDGPPAVRNSGLLLFSVSRLSVETRSAVAAGDMTCLVSPRDAQ